MGNKVSLTEADVWRERKRFDMAMRGDCPIILRPPFATTNRCVGDECPIYDKCGNKRYRLTASAKEVLVEYELDRILGLI